MKPSAHRTPMQLVLLSFAGFVLCAGSLPLLRFVHTADACHNIRWTPALLLFGLFVAGVIVYLKATTALKNGIRNQQWPEEQLQPLRSVFESPLIQVLVCALLVAYAILWLTHSHFRDLGLACFILMQVLSQLQIAVRRPRTPRPNPLVDWRNFAPIHSDHWGQR